MKISVARIQSLPHIDPMKEKVIELEVADTQTNVERGQCDICETFDTIKEARARAKLWLDPEFYRRASETDNVMRYARIMVNGECLYDFFAKGYCGDPQEVEA